jgi:acyl carrier protein
MTDLNARIRSFIADELSWDGSAAELTDDYLLLETEVLDSLAIYDLVQFIEEEIDVEIDDEDLVPDNFATISAISAMVRAKQSAGMS